VVNEDAKLADGAVVVVFWSSALGDLTIGHGQRDDVRPADLWYGVVVTERTDTWLPARPMTDVRLAINYQRVLLGCFNLQAQSVTLVASIPEYNRNQAQAPRLPSLFPFSVPFSPYFFSILYLFYYLFSFLFFFLFSLSLRLLSSLDPLGGLYAECCKLLQRVQAESDRQTVCGAFLAKTALLMISNLHRLHPSQNFPLSYFYWAQAAPTMYKDKSPLVTQRKSLNMLSYKIFKEISHSVMQLSVYQIVND